MFFKRKINRIASVFHAFRVACFQIKPMFFDFDQPQHGLVSQDQFHRVLHTVGLAEILTQREFEAICKKFLVRNSVL